MRKEIVHAYNILIIRTTRNNSDLTDIYLEQSFEKHLEGDDTTITELYKLHYENKEMTEEYAVEIFDLMESFTRPFLASSIYIQCDPQHSKIISSLIKSNLGYIKGDVEIKLVTNVGFIQIK